MFNNSMKPCWELIDKFFEDSQKKEGEIADGTDRNGMIGFVDIETYIQLVGNTISMICLFISIFIFLSFK